MSEYSRGTNKRDALNKSDGRKNVKKLIRAMALKKSDSWKTQSLPWKFFVDINVKKRQKTGYTHVHANNIKTECLQEFKNCANNFSQYFLLK